MNRWTQDDIINALHQAIKYRLSLPIGTPMDAKCGWQYAIKGRYPHYYFNNNELSFREACETADSVEDSQYLEFPIIKDGVLQAGKNSKIDVGTDHVVFKLKISAVDGFSWVYCGLMTYFTHVRVTALVGDREKEVLP